MRTESRVIEGFHTQVSSQPLIESALKSRRNSVGGNYLTTSFLNIIFQFGRKSPQGSDREDQLSFYACIKQVFLSCAMTRKMHKNSYVDSAQILLTSVG